MIRQASSTFLQPLVCRWEYCTKSFRSSQELHTHVVDHVRKVEPFLRRDLPDVLRVEEGIGESMSMTAGLPVLSSIAHQAGEGMPSNKPDPQPEEELSSSLPSPPHSNHNASPQMHIVRMPSHKEQPPQPTVEPELDPKPGIHEVDVNTNASEPNSLTTPVSARFYMGDDMSPSFGALSSPGSSIEPINPPSPEFSSMVDDVIRTKRKRVEFESGLFERPVRRVRLPPSTSIDSHISSSSNASVQSVEHQLTQSLDFDDSKDAFERYIHVERLQAEPCLDGISQRAESNPYIGEIFESRGPLASQAALVCDPDVPVLTQASDSQLSTETHSQTNAEPSSSNPEPPPPAQRPRDPSSSLDDRHGESQSIPDPLSQSQATSSVSSGTISQPQLQSWYSPPMSRHTFSKPKVSALLSNSPQGSPICGKKSPKNVFFSGTLPLLSESLEAGPSGTNHLVRRSLVIEHAPDGGLIHRHHHLNHGHHLIPPPQEEEKEEEEEEEETSDPENESQSQEFYPFPTQAPYDSQPASYY